MEIQEQGKDYSRFFLSLTQDEGHKCNTKQKLALVPALSIFLMTLLTPISNLGGRKWGWNRWGWKHLFATEEKINYTEMSVFKKKIETITELLSTKENGDGAKWTKLIMDAFDPEWL